MSVLKHVAQHVAQDALKETAQGAGCMVTLLAMLTGLGALCALVVAVFA